MGSDGLYVPNAGLTELGRRQAAQAAARVATFSPDASFTSNLPRAIETAEHFSSISNHQALQISDLAEMNTGNIWGASDAIKKKITTGDYHVDYKSMGGETIAEFSERVVVGFEQLMEAATLGRFARIAAFLHEGVIGTIIDHMEGRATFESERRERMPYGALITVDTENSAPHFPGYWETDHLDEITS